MRKIDNQNFLNIVHVGGRGGGVDFPLLSTQFNKDVLNVLFDADENCIDHIKSQWGSRKIIVKPFCLSNEDGYSDLNINYDPYQNSLLEFNEKFGHYYHTGHDKKTDYLNSETMKSLKKIKLKTNKLDTLVDDGSVPPPDVLLLSTTGSELDILKGSLKALQNSIIAVSSRTHFAEIRHGGKLVGEMEDFMKKLGFILVKIEPSYIGYNRIPSEYRGAGVPVSGDLIYLLDPKLVKRKNDKVYKEKLQKLAFTATNFGYTEIAYEAIEISNKVNIETETSNSVIKFLKELSFEMNIKKELPLLWHERWSHEKIQNRTKFVTKQNYLDRIKKHILNSKKNPFEYFKFLLSKFIINLIQSLKIKTRNFFKILRLEITTIPKNSRFEKFLLKNGFFYAVERIKNRRKGYYKRHIN